MKFDLKVHMNKKNGQLAVHLPKRFITSIPTKVSVEIPKCSIKKINIPRGFK